MSDCDTQKSEAFDAAGWAFRDELRELLEWSFRFDERKANPPPKDHP